MTDSYTHVQCVGPNNYRRTTYRRPPEVRARIYVLYAMVYHQCQRKDPRLEGLQISIGHEMYARTILCNEYLRVTYISDAWPEPCSKSQGHVSSQTCKGSHTHIANPSPGFARSRGRSDLDCRHSGQRDQDVACLICQTDHLVIKKSNGSCRMGEGRFLQHRHDEGMNYPNWRTLMSCASPSFHEYTTNFRWHPTTR